MPSTPEIPGVTELNEETQQRLFEFEHTEIDLGKSVLNPGLHKPNPTFLTVPIQKV